MSRSSAWSFEFACGGSRAGLVATVLNWSFGSRAGLVAKCLVTVVESDSLPGYRRVR